MFTDRSCYQFTGLSVAIQNRWLCITCRAVCMAACMHHIGVHAQVPVSHTTHAHTHTPRHSHNVSVWLKVLQH
jgi:hypothetical protein